MVIQYPFNSEWLPAQLLTLLRPQTSFKFSLSRSYSRLAGPRNYSRTRQSAHVTNPTKQSQPSTFYQFYPSPSLYVYARLSLTSTPHFLSHMSDPSRFRALFEAALQDYQIQTGTALVNHPLAEKLQICNSVESVTTVLREQARAFNEFPGDNGRIVKSLNGIVSVLYTLSSSAASVGLVRRLGEVSTATLHL